MIRKERVRFSLDGIWQVGESMECDSMPQKFDHEAPVPALANVANPPFPQVGEFSSKEYAYNQTMMRQATGDFEGKIFYVDEEAKAHYAGISRQPRNYFWYRRTFEAPEKKNHAMLIVNKAYFGSKIWVNDIVVGSTDNCFTSEKYDISNAIRWGATNEICIRIGAHPAVLPEGNFCNTDFEKEEWMPGIVDSVEVQCFDGIMIDGVQIGPRIDPKKIIVETTLKNLDEVFAVAALEQYVTGNKDDTVFGRAKAQTVGIKPGETLTVRTEIALPDAELWWPENPALYLLKSFVGGDSDITRFGLREFRFDTPTKGAYLNGKRIFLRGSNIELPRFLEDPLVGTLPWNEEWLRGLLDEKPKKMHWNMLKFCISPVPKKWFDIADEAGLLVLYEFPMWTLSQDFYGYEKEYEDKNALREVYLQWMKDCWNHPCIAYFNACEETKAVWMADEIIRPLRKMDLSNRPWGNSYCIPEGPDDPIEDHPYEFNLNMMPASYGIPPFDMINLEPRIGFDRPSAVGKVGIASAHAHVITEYGWLWVTRDGNPTLLTRNFFDKLPYPTATPKERITTSCYLLAGLTEYWRAFRNYAGIMFFNYLGCSKPNGYTCDYFEDVEALKLHPQFEDYVGEAFKPMGVYLSFWRRELTKGKDMSFFIMLCNDEEDEKSGVLTLTLESDSQTIPLMEKTFVLRPCGQITLDFDGLIPDVTGKFTLVAKAAASNGETTVSRRWVELVEDPEANNVKYEEVQHGQFQ